MRTVWTDRAKDIMFGRGLTYLPRGLVIPVVPGAPTQPANLRTTSIGQTTVDIAWDPSTDDVGVTNYRIYRDGVLIGQGPGSSGGFADVWSDSGLTCETTYLYGVEAEDIDGNISSRATLAVPTATCAQTGNILEFSGTVSSATFAAAVSAAPAGPLTVRPTGGVGTFTVNNPGDWIPTRQNVTVQKGVFRDLGIYPTVTPGGITATGSGFVFEDCTIHCYWVNGASNWTFRRCNFPFNHVSYGGEYGVPTGSGAGGCVQYRCSNWLIENCNFSGFIVDADPSQHTEAINIGVGNNGGVISGCSFNDGGTTGALFFTYWNGNDTLSDYPKNICVKNCSFTNIFNPYQDCVSFESLYVSRPDDLNISVNPNCTHVGPQTLCIPTLWIRSC